MPSKFTFQESAAKYEAWLNCVVYSYGGDNPAIGLDRDVVKKLSELNAAFDVDLYVSRQLNIAD